MRKSTFTPLYEAFRAKLVAMRKTSGLTQRDLAKRLGREHSFVSRMELGERRLDVRTIQPQRTTAGKRIPISASMPGLESRPLGREHQVTAVLGVDARGEPRRWMAFPNPHSRHRRRGRD